MGTDTSTTVKAVFTKLWPNGGRGEPVIREVILELDDNGWVHMSGGPTGYESFRPDLARARDRGWLANFGNGTYDECIVPAEELAAGLRALGIIKEEVDLDRSVYQPSGPLRLEPTFSQAPPRTRLAQEPHPQRRQLEDPQDDIPALLRAGRRGEGSAPVMAEGKLAEARRDLDDAIRNLSHARGAVDRAEREYKEAQARYERIWRLYAPAKEVAR